MTRNDTLRIAELTLASGGMIGLSILPGKVQPHGLTGFHRRDLATDLDVIAAWNASVVVVLVEQQELVAYKAEEIGRETRRRHMEYLHLPIADVTAPAASFDRDWPSHSARLRTVLGLGGRIFVCCRGGLGRSGTIVARLLVELGTGPAEAVVAVRKARPGAIETDAQKEWVARGRAAPLPEPSRDEAARRDRAVGALVGLAVGDAVGTTLEFTRKPRFAVLDDMIGAGPFRLKAGVHTDDTSMALALADSLLNHPKLDPADLMRRFLSWYRDGAYSATGTCFDIGNATRAALESFERTGVPLAGSPADSQSGNGALMRLAPVAVRHWYQEEEMVRIVELQTRTTHGSPATLRASNILARMLAAAISGASLPNILNGPLGEEVEGGWCGLHRDVIEGSGWVVDTLRAAVWAVSRTTDFRSAIVLAANLGQDSDTVAAVAGQIAGAVYGVAGIPAEWRERLAWRNCIEDAGERLFDAGMERINRFMWGPGDLVPVPQAGD